LAEAKETYDDVIRRLRGQPEAEIAMQAQTAPDVCVQPPLKAAAMHSWA